jgi:hypothetical protein
MEKTCVIVDTAADNDKTTQKKLASRHADDGAEELILRIQGFIADADIAPILHKNQYASLNA